MPLFKKRKKEIPDINTIFRFTSGYVIVNEDMNDAREAYRFIIDEIRSLKEKEVSFRRYEYDLYLVEAKASLPFWVICTTPDQEFVNAGNKISELVFDAPRSDIEIIHERKLVNIFTSQDPFIIEQESV